MMKSSVMRQARLCRVALQAANRLHISSRLSPSVSALSVSARCPVPFQAIRSLPRFYSSETAASESPAESPELTTRFADLVKLGVHPKLVEAITRGMKYEDMTQVQSLTISPALKGKDL